MNPQKAHGLSLSTGVFSSTRATLGPLLIGVEYRLSVNRYAFVAI